MKMHNSTHRWLPLIAVLASLLLAGYGAFAQQGGGTRPGGGGDSGGNGGAFSAFRDAHKYTFQLSRMASNIGHLNEDKTAPLTAKQAKQLLKVLTPLRKKSSLTQDEAKTALKGLKAVLTVQQLNAIGRMKDHRFGAGPGGRQGGAGGPGGGPGGAQGAPGRMGGPGGSGGPGGNRPRFDPSAMKNFNPFNPPKNSPMGNERAMARWTLFYNNLNAIAAGKPITMPKRMEGPGGPGGPGKFGAPGASPAGHGAPGVTGGPAGKPDQKKHGK